MTGAGDALVAHTIATIGLTLNVFAALPLNEMTDGSATGVYQPVADTTGIVFVRYGPDDTVDRYVARLGGMFTDVSITSDIPVVVDGQQARRVTVRIASRAREMYTSDPSQGVTHRALPEEVIEISVLAFSHRGMWILAGYRMPELSLERYREVLERMLGSISLS
jgi:hypothetical protein